jgi:ketosteroid isomerase-like protein
MSGRDVPEADATLATSRLTWALAGARASLWRTDVRGIDSASPDVVALRRRCRPAVPQISAVRLERRILVLRPALAFAAVLMAPSLRAQAPAAEAEIRCLEQMEARAVLAKDSATLRTLWDKELVVNNPDNRVVTANADPIDRPVMQKARTAFTRTVERITFRGDFAFSMGSETLVPSGDQPRAGQTVVRRYTNIWMRQPDGWKLVARHANVVCP